MAPTLPVWNPAAALTASAPTCASGSPRVPTWNPSGSPSLPRWNPAGELPEPSAAAQVAAGVLSTASMAASAYHGYKRNRSVGWAVAWGVAGAIFPIITPVIAVAQGFGKPAKK
jgi:hypothetical protein